MRHFHSVGVTRGDDRTRKGVGDGVERRDTVDFQRERTRQGEDARFVRVGS